VGSPPGRSAPVPVPFFATHSADPATIHHLGLYIGARNMISAPHTGDVVRVASVDGFGGYGRTPRTDPPSVRVDRWWVQAAA